MYTVENFKLGVSTNIFDFLYVDQQASSQQRAQYIQVINRKLRSSVVDSVLSALLPVT